MGRPQGAQEGQHRLRSARFVHRVGRHARRHHGGDAQAFPLPVERAVALVALPRLDALLPFFQLAQALAGTSLTAFEFLCGDLMGFVTRHIPGTRLPLAKPAPWYALVEISGMATGTASPLLDAILADALAAGLMSDAAVAGSLTQADELWRLREAASEAQKGEGGSIKHDISVPVARIAEFIDAAWLRRRARLSGRAARAVRSLRRRQRALQCLAAARDGARRVHYADGSRCRAPCTTSSSSFGGSISAEHGIGQLKAGELQRVKSAVEIDIMRRIKSALDPKGILSPGKVLGT